MGVAVSRNLPRALARGIAGAAPEGLTDIATGFGQTFAHRFAALGANWRVGGGLLLVATFEACGGQSLAEAALLTKGFALSLFLAAEHVQRPADQQQQSVGGQIGIVGGKPAVEFVVSVSFDVLARSEPSAMFTRPERAAWVIWSNCRPVGSLRRSRKVSQKRQVASWITLARVKLSSFR